MIIIDMRKTVGYVNLVLGSHIDANLAFADFYAFLSIFMSS